MNGSVPAQISVENCAIAILDEADNTQFMLSVSKLPRLTRF